MIEDGDKVMGLPVRRQGQLRHARRPPAIAEEGAGQFAITAVNLDQKQPGFPEHVLPEYLRLDRRDFHIIEQDTYSVVTRVVPEGKTLCSLCSRLRRGALYTYAGKTASPRSRSATTATTW